MPRAATAAVQLASVVCARAATWLRKQQAIVQQVAKEQAASVGWRSAIRFAAVAAGAAMRDGKIVATKSSGDLFLLLNKAVYQFVNVYLLILFLRCALLHQTRVFWVRVTQACFWLLIE